MLASIKHYFQQHLLPGDHDSSGEVREERVRLAATALLLEMARVNEDDDPDEFAAIIQAVRERFGLPGEAVDELLALAREEAYQSTDYYEFTSLINSHYDIAERVSLVEHLWQVAAADGHVDKYQEALIRKLADLLYVPHREFIATKLRVVGDRLNAPGGENTRTR